MECGWLDLLDLPTQGYQPLAPLSHPCMACWHQTLVSMRLTDSLCSGDVERGEVESKYSSAYEEKINPFTDFRSKERESRRRQMHVADRLMYEFWQLISSNK